VVSPSIDAWYQDKIGPKSSAIILNSPLISKETLCESDHLRKIFLIPPGQKIFIYVGILGPGRGIDLVTQAFTHPTMTSHLVFLGYGDWADELKRLSTDHPNIHVHDPVPHSEVVNIVKSADFGLCLVQNVSLSDYYCLPNKLFEYCFAGVPVLASDFPDIRFVLDTYGVGKCCGLDSESVRTAVQGLATGGEKFQFADLKPLSWQAQEPKLLDLYRSLFRGSSY
jgi:glycosyltransferase involved in cell wall biosynthesis